MAKRVNVIASGEAERRALPHVVRHLQDRAVFVDDVRIPPRDKALDARMAERLIRAAWYENLSAPPDRFVLVVDLDGADPDPSLEPIQKRVAKLRHEISAAVLCAYAREHLEAWYFADAENVKGLLPQELDLRLPTWQAEYGCPHPS